MNEREVEIIIDTNLQNKGWVLNGSKKNVFKQEPKTEEQKKKLRNSQNNQTFPDYILYKTGTDQPIAIIEAKKGGANLDYAINQGTSYAKCLGAPLVFAMNGSYCETRYVPNQLDLFLNGNEVRELIREVEALKFLDSQSNEAFTIPKEMIISRQELIRVFKKANDKLREAGIMSGYDRISEFGNILFLKLMSEKDDTESYWNQIKRQSDKLLINFINNTVINGYLKPTYGGDVFEETSIQNQNLLREIIDLLDPLILSSIDVDVKGDAFEYFLKNMHNADNDLGQYFTPRHVVKTIVNLVDPKFNEKIYDPFCGSGGFLIEAFNYIKENSVLDKENLKKLQTETLYGGDITNVAKIAKWNMILHGDGHNHINKINSLENPRDGEFDVAITNIPFSLKTNRHADLYYGGVGKNSDATCVFHCLQSLKQGGRMAVVVPEGFLFKDQLAEARKFLLSKAKLQSVVSLPQGVFKPYTGVKTDVLFFTNAHELQSQKSYWYFDVKNDGYTLNDHRRPIKGKNDLHKLDESDFRKAVKDENVKQNMLDIGFEIVDLEKVKQSKYNLVGARYREAEKDISNYELVRLGSIAKIESGNSAPQEQNLFSEGIYPFFRVSDVAKFHLSENLIETKDKLNSQGTKGLTLFKKGSILFPKSGASILLNHRAIMGCDGYVASHLAVIVAYETQVSHRYLYYILCSVDAKEISLNEGYPSVRLKDLEEIKIPLPSIEEQQRIVSELDAIQKSIDNAKALIENLKIAGGGYSMDFGNEPIETMRLGDICEKIFAGGDAPLNAFSKTKTKEYEVPIYSNGVDDNSLYGYTNIPKVEKPCVTISARGTIGYAIPRNEKFYPIVRLLVLLPKDFVDYRYLAYAINRTNIASTGTSTPQLTVPQISEIQIPVPSIETQQQIVDEMEKQITYIKQTESVIAKQQEKIKKAMAKIWQKHSTELNQNEDKIANKSVFDAIIAQASKPLK